LPLRVQLVEYRLLSDLIYLNNAPHFKLAYLKTFRARQNLLASQLKLKIREIYKVDAFHPLEIWKIEIQTLYLACFIDFWFSIQLWDTFFLRLWLEQHNHLLIDYSAPWYFSCNLKILAGQDAFLIFLVIATAKFNLIFISSD
jgi:hypothetical protein